MTLMLVKKRAGYNSASPENVGGNPVLLGRLCILPGINMIFAVEWDM